MAEKKLETDVKDALAKTEKEKQKRIFDGVADKDGEWREWGQGEDNA